MSVGGSKPCSHANRFNPVKTLTQESARVSRSRPAYFAAGSDAPLRHSPSICNTWCIGSRPDSL